MGSLERQDDATLAATVTIVALQGLVSSSENFQHDYVLLLPALRPMGRDDAISLLARLPKPLSCIAMELSETLVIGWWERDASNEHVWVEFWKDIADLALESYRVRRTLQGKERTFALLMDGEVMAVSLSTCERWLLDYNFPLVSVRVDDATGELESQGFAAVIRLARAQGGHLNAVDLG